MPPWCHPGVPEALDAYDEDRFAALLASTPFVSEVGLDGGARGSVDQQAEVLSSVLSQLARSLRLVSIHSKRATKRTLDLIESSGVEGAILHWWLGSDAETRRALDLGALFSVNRSMDVAKLRATGVPLSHLLPETDHPSGNRRGGGLKQPGWTVDVEESVAAVYGTKADLVRQQFWSTLAGQVDGLGLAELLPPVVNAMLAHAR